ncbi:MAG: FtsQ-type POTRA domain-containing protein [Clostridia bacterium]|nr:FtsQ-type POTRA domain-containing protein [Clostridia bacterium]
MKKGKSLEQMKQYTRKQRARMKVMIFFLALVLLLVGAYFLGTRYLVINDIVISSSVYYTENELIKTSGLKKGESIFTCNNSEVEKILYSRHPYISRVDVRKKFPSTIEITVEEQDGAMYIPLLNDGYAINSDMKVLGRIKDSENKIEIRTSGVKRCMVGEPVKFSQSREGYLSSTIYATLDDCGLSKKTKFLDVRDRFNIILNYDGRFDVYIGDDESIEHKIKILEKVVVDFPSEKGKITINNNNRAIITLEE